MSISTKIDRERVTTTRASDEQRTERSANERIVRRTIVYHRLSTGQP